MGLMSPNVRTLTRVCGATLLSLLCASIGSAAPIHRRGAVRSVCDPQTPAHRKLARHPRSFGGPLAVRSQSSRLTLMDLTARLRRGMRANLASDPEAIQNDAPAARLEADERATPPLRALGVLIGSAGGRPDTPAFSPRSPRGPPTSA
jgi:hypothetical protein